MPAIALSGFENSFGGDSMVRSLRDVAVEKLMGVPSTQYTLGMSSP
uniref:Uncharacterized protein n=1 Tax=Anguilla anguilla TaxID=7936 RepID=A0A0E9TZV9_ANGAN